PERDRQRRREGATLSQELDRILDADYLGDVGARSLDEVGTMRAECQAVETSLSYLRRMVQGRLDIVQLECRRREEGREPGDLATLIAELPEVLAENTRSPGNGRLPQLLAPGDLDADLEQQLDRIVEGHDVETLPTI